MNKKINSKQYKKLEESLREVYGDQVEMNKTYKRSLDKLVANSIAAKKVEENLKIRKEKNQSLFTKLLYATKFQIAFLSSLVVIFLAGGISYAAFPSVRESVNEALVPTKGSIYLNSEPQGASVFLKGGKYSEYTRVGITPFADKLKADNYKVKFQLDNYEQYETKVTVSVGKRSELEVNLRQKVTILESIREWKTYADTQNGFEFIYPLTWNLSTGSENYLVKVYDVNSTLELVKGEPDFPELSKFEYDENIYSGWIKDEKYYIFEVLQEGENKVTLVYETGKKSNFKIFDFIISNFKIYEVQKFQNEEIENYVNDSIGISLSYPAAKWIIIEEDQAKVKVKNQDKNHSSFEIFQTDNYLKELNEYTKIEDFVINNMQVKKYSSGEEKNISIYQFPNRIFVKYYYFSDLSIECEEILNSFVATDGNKYETIYDYELSLKFILQKSSWNYSEVGEKNDPLNAPDSNKVIYENFTNPSKFYIYNWNNVSQNWTDFKSSLDFDNIVVRNSEVLVNGQTIYRNAVWIREKDESGNYVGNNYILGLVIYSSDELVSDNLETNQAVLQINGNSLVIIYKPGTESSNIIGSKIEEDESILLELDAIISSIEVISYH